MVEFLGAGGGELLWPCSPPCSAVAGDGAGPWSLLLPWQLLCPARHPKNMGEFAGAKGIFYRDWTCFLAPENRVLRRFMIDIWSSDVPWFAGFTDVKVTRMAMSCEDLLQAAWFAAVRRPTTLLQVGLPGARAANQRLGRPCHRGPSRWADGIETGVYKIQFKAISWGEYMIE